MDGNENAGTIASFDKETGRLVVDLFNGDMVAGTVNDQTEIECDEAEAEHHGATASHDGSDDSGSGSNSGPGSGDDQDHSGQPPTAEDPDHSEPGPGDDQNDNEDENENEANCTTDALVVGATVEEAGLELQNGMAVFEEIELAD